MPEQAVENRTRARVVDSTRGRPPGERRFGYVVSPSSAGGESHHAQAQEDEHGGTLVYLDKPDVLDDGPTKPVRIWSRIGRRPIVAGGNSNGDIPMLHYTGSRSRQGLRLLLLHDDPEREFEYTPGAETSLERASNDGWTVVSIKNDWATVFADTSA